MKWKKGLIVSNIYKRSYIKSRVEADEFIKMKYKNEVSDDR